MSDADVLVLGGGPAGSAAAITCAAAGLAVVLAEGRAFPRHRPGETLHPAIEPLLERLGALAELHQAGYLRHPGVWTRRGEEAWLQPYGADASGPWLGWQAPRSDFDARLLGRAQALGVRVLQPLRARSAWVDGGRVRGVLTDSGPLAARFTIDAAGGRHFLARELGLRVRRHSPPLVAWYGYVAGACRARDDAPAVSVDARGWSWTARVAPGRYAWSRLDWRPGSGPPDRLPAEFDELSGVDSLRGADVTWRIVEPSAGPGFFLVGDAAAVLDPAAAHGVIRGIMGGTMAGYLIARITSLAGEQVAARSYDNWLSTEFDRALSRLRQLYQEFPHPPDWMSEYQERQSRRSRRV
jgi:flavin-dependent dehydrogenase